MEVGDSVAPELPSDIPDRDVPDRREDLVEAAVELFSERPYEDVSVDDVASAAGVAKGLLYYYFGSKRGLYATGLERLASEMRTHILAAAEVEGGDPTKILERSFDAHLDFVEQRAAGYRALLGSVAAHPEVRAIVERERNFHREMIEAHIPPEVPRTPAVKLAVKGWLHFVDGVILAWIERREPHRDEVRELCARTLIAAITAAVTPQLAASS